MSFFRTSLGLRNSIVESACRALEKILYKPGEVDYFMRQVLVFRAENVDRIQVKEQTASKQIREAFRLWKGGKGLKPTTIESLLKSLQDHDKHNLAEQLAKKLNVILEKSKRQETEEDQLDKAIGVCEMQIPKKRARSFFRTSLGLKDSIVESLQDDKFVRQGFLKWKEINGSEANVASLLKSLEKADKGGFHDVADKIREKLNYPPDTAMKQATGNKRNDPVKPKNHDGLPEKPGTSKEINNRPGSFTSSQQKSCKRRQPLPIPPPPQKHKTLKDFDDDKITESTGLLEISPEMKNKAFLAGPELPTKTTRETDGTKQGPTVEQSDKNDSESESVYYDDYDKDQDNREMKYVNEFSEEPSKEDKAGPEPPEDVTRETLSPESDPPTINARVRPTSPPRNGQQQGQSKEPRYGTNPGSSRDTRRRRLTSDSSEVTSPASGTSGARPPTPEAIIKGEDGDGYPTSYDERNDRIEGEFLNYFDEPADGRGVKGSHRLPNGDAKRPSVTNKKISETERPEEEPFLSSSEKRKKKKAEAVYV